jgi:hypothetical protein
MNALFRSSSPMAHPLNRKTPERLARQRLSRGSSDVLQDVEPTLTAAGPPDRAFPVELAPKYRRQILADIVRDELTGGIGSGLPANRRLGAVTAGLAGLDRALEVAPERGISGELT